MNELFKKKNKNKNDKESYTFDDEFDIKKDVNCQNDINSDNVEKLSNIKITEHLNDDFKNNLVKMMTEEYEKDDKYRIIENNNEVLNNNTIKNSSIKTHSFFKRFAILFSFFIIISSVVFGKNFKSFVGHIFSNQDKSVDLAIENGYYQNIDMDYIYNDGVGIKVDYVYSDDTCIYVAFNVLAEEEFDALGFYNFNIKSDNITVYDTNSANEVILYEEQLKRINSKNAIKIIKLYYLDNTYKKLDNIEINISKIVLEFKNNQKELINDWNYSILVNDSPGKSEIVYDVENKNLLEDYKISLENTKLSIIANFKNEENISYNRNDIYVEDENGNKYYCNDLYFFDSKKIQMKFSFNSNKYNDLKLIIKLKDKDNRIVLYLKKDSQT